MGARILIADDDRDFGESVAALLGERGHRVDLVGDGRKAVERFRAGRYDLTLLDVRMPGLSGVDVLQAILGLDPSARVAMMTAFEVPEVLVRARKAGAWAVFAKPLPLALLYQITEQLDVPGVVLVVDDDADFAASLAAAIEADGLAAMTAGSGREAIDLISTRRFDVLVLDLHLGSMHGVDVYGELLRLGLNPPTLIVSAHADMRVDHIARFQRHGVEGIFVKPMQLEPFMGKVRALIDDRRPA